MGFCTRAQPAICAPAANRAATSFLPPCVPQGHLRRLPGQGRRRDGVLARARPRVCTPARCGGRATLRHVPLATARAGASGCGCALGAGVWRVGVVDALKP
eukprot:6524095-Prymnesium_polylepis.2